MYHVILAVYLSYVLLGCSTVNSGNYLSKASENEQVSIAQEATKQLVTMWPPGRTQFVITQDTNNSFGSALTKTIRDAGYALHEAQAKDDSGSAGRPNGIPLAYIVDQVDSNIIRLSMTIGGQTITRPYVIQDGKAIAAGHWTRKE